MSGSGTQGAREASDSDAERSAAAAPKRVRGPRKSTVAALKAAEDVGYARGWRACDEENKTPMLGALIAWVIWSGITFGLGAWLF